MMIGFPRIAGVPWAVTKGEVVGRKAKTLVFSGAVDEGSSGGPLIKGNQIIGVVTEMTGKFAHATPALIATYVLEGYGVKFGARLRDRPASLKKDEIERLLSESKNFRHEYEAKTLGDARVIIDHATALMWQRTSSLTSSRNLENALKAIAELNAARFAGFQNWRLPTSEEVISLLEERGEHEGQFLSDLFENESIVWTSDKIGLSGPFTSGPGIVVRFDTRSVEWDVSVAFVRAVRSIEASRGSSKDATSSSASVKPASHITAQAREITGKDGAPMVLVPAGEFTMGSREDDKSAEDNERPAHRVYLDAFYIDQYEVTTSRYATFFQETGRAAPKYWPEQVLKQHERKPIIGMDWNDAQAYCAWAGKRLPTEAEWEKAARGTDQSLYPWGNEPSSEQRKSFYFEGLYEGLTNVGSVEGGKSPYGSYDMAGSVWEWTADWYDESYYGKSPKGNPQGPSSGKERVLRGGSCNFMPCDGRSAFRFRYPPTSWHMGSITIGFRCAQDVQQ
jgi:formylglycine-generating enzyme required for sulfatase activity